MNTGKVNSNDGEKNFFIFVDGEKFHAPARSMTPNEIITKAAELDPATHYLLRRKGNEPTDYRENGNVAIELEKADRFEVISFGATPVS